LSVKRHHSSHGVLSVKLAYVLRCTRPEVRRTPDQRILCIFCDYCEKMYYGLLRQSSRILYCKEARSLWCLRTKLHICAAWFSHRKMELIM